MKIGILAVQGAFIEHETKLARLGAECIELRQKSDLEKKFEGLVLPGGESTVQGKLLRELNMFQTLKTEIEGGMPVLATCAGLILLAEKLSNDSRVYFGTLPVTVKRNAYGTQLNSFVIKSKIKEISENEIPLVFIRAPWIENAKSNVKILSKINNHITAARQKNMLATSFHPELTNNNEFHKYFINMIKETICTK